MKKFLRKNFNWLHKIASKTYQRLFYFGTKVFGTKMQEWSWKIKYLFKHKSWLEARYEMQEQIPKLRKLRQLLVDKISSYAPLTSALEFGCGTGRNLYLLAKKFSDAKLMGIDVHKKAVLFGQKCLQQEGVANVTLLVGNADALKQFKDNSFDVTFTAAVMIYVGPDKIKQVVGEMIRTTNKALVFAEPHGGHNENDPSGMGVYYGGQWLRNFSDLLRPFGIDEKRITFTKIPTDIWGNDYYGTIAYLIEADLSGLKQERDESCWP